MIREDIPDLLKERRKELRLTLEEAGKRLGVSKTTYRDYENGTLLVSNMKFEKIIALSTFLKMTPNDLFGLNRNILFEFNKHQFKNVTFYILNNCVNDLTEDEKKYLIKSIKLICK